MNRNRKVLGPVLLIALALGTQEASAADSHQFQFDGQKTVLTGKNTNTHVFTMGTEFKVKCANASFEGTVDAGEETEVDEIVVKPTYSNCEFGGHEAQVFATECTYRLDSDTSTGNPTGGSHATFTICSMQIDTILCTLTVAKQEVTGAVRYENDTASSVNFTFTAHGIVVNRAKTTPSQNSCLLIAIGPVLRYGGTVTNECRQDESESQTDPIKDETTTECAVTDI